ncbi:MAG: hypothetical protein OXE40_12015, partial [Gammaproteobacteria bacterium]|nr:hypothetical protein [Gammaproteobacteria bacterium]
MLPPAPTSTYKSQWQLFVSWCEKHHMQHWPASPATVADYLTDRADRCKSGTLKTARTAISSTHREAGLESPCETRLVRETIRDLCEAKEGQRDFRRSVGGISLDGAEIETMRNAALERRVRGVGLESATSV